MKYYGDKDIKMEVYNEEYYEDDASDFKGVVSLSYTETKDNPNYEEELKKYNLKKEEHKLDYEKNIKEYNSYIEEYNKRIVQINKIFEDFDPTSTLE